MKLMETVTFDFGKANAGFMESFFALFPQLLESTDGGQAVVPANRDQYPRIILCVKSGDGPVAVEFSGQGQTDRVEVVNKTGQQKNSPERYSHITLEDLKDRLRHHGIHITKVDHIGFNLPWFGGGAHPAIQKLRDAWFAGCLYHGFPGGEPWDFILPGTPAEIAALGTAWRPGIERRPKVELVSFPKSSVPLIQFEVVCDGDKESFPAIFPEGLYDLEIKNIWVYLQNPCGLDLCLVLNADGGGDWSDFFAGTRVTAAN